MIHPDLPHLRAKPSRLVRRIAAEDSPAAAELFSVITRQRKAWTYTDWIARLKSLDKCDQTVSEWLDCPNDWFD